MFQAVWVSRTIAPLVGQADFRAHVLASFPSACNLLAADGSVVTVVTRAVGNGPLNLVVDGRAALPVCRAGVPAHGDGHTLDVGGIWQVNLADAAVWEPMPDYGVLRRFAVNYPVAALSHLENLLTTRAPSESLATLLCQDGSLILCRPYQQRAQKHVAALLAAHAIGDLDGITTHAAALVGLGPGLTPAGDDWLAGWLIGLRLRETFQPADVKLRLTDVATAVLHVAAGRTHALSLSLLRAAAAGEVNVWWHVLLSAIAASDVPAVGVAAAQVMKYGKTSGSDMLAGFLSALALDSGSDACYEGMGLRRRNGPYHT